MHKLSNIRPDERVADCEECGPDSKVRFRKHAGRFACRVGDERKSPEGWRKHRESVNRARRWKDVPGMTVAIFDALMFDQGGACAICGGVNKDGRNLSADHCHKTGRIRGLLCARCNRSIGAMGDDPELLLRAVDYLNRPERRGGVPGPNLWRTA